MCSEVDAEQIGIWCSSYSGAHALLVGAIGQGLKELATAEELDLGRVGRPGGGAKKPVAQGCVEDEALADLRH